MAEEKSGKEVFERTRERKQRKERKYRRRRRIIIIIKKKEEKRWKWNRRVKIIKKSKNLK